MDCGECDELWKAYECAVFEHVRLGNRLKMANASGDPEAISRLEAEVGQELERRTGAREALLLHERESGHGGS